MIGNPPFQSQLATPTARDAVRAAAARRRFGGVAAPYADSATLFLVLGCELAAPGGRVAMIQPESVLSARDAGPARRALRERAALVGLWWAGEPVFDCSTSSSVARRCRRRCCRRGPRTLGGRVGRGEVRGDDVGDVREVARLEPVAVHDRVAPVEQRVDEQRDHRRVGRVGSLARRRTR